MPTYTANFNLPKPNVNSADDEDLWGGQLNDGMDLIDTQLKTNADAAVNALAGIVPVGCVFDFTGTSAPVGYLLCYGQAISRATYSDLFNLIGVTYGVGDGSATFNLPDLRGYVTAGKDDMGGVSADRLTNQSGGVDGDTLGATGGAETHILIVDEMPSHPGHRQAGGAANTGSGATLNSFIDQGGDQPHNNVQPTIILNKIIKT